MSAPDMNPYRDEPEGSYCESCKELQPWTSSCPACGAGMCDRCERSIGCAYCEKHEDPCVKVSDFSYYEWSPYARSGDKHWHVEYGERTIGGGGDIEQDIPNVCDAPTFCELLRDQTGHVEAIACAVWDRWEELRDAQFGKAVPA